MTLPTIYAAPATLSGIGSPVGVVTPQFINQQYVDTTPGPSWLSTGLTDTDWIELSSGGGSSLVLGLFLFTFQHPFYNPSGAGALIQCGLPLDPSNPGLLSTGDFRTITFPLFTSAASGTVVNLQEAPVQVSGVDTTNDSISLGLTVYISNLLNTEQMILEGTGIVAQSGPGASGIVWRSDVSVTAQTGTDLTYDNTTGIVATTAGGAYSVVGLAGAGYT